MVSISCFVEHCKAPFLLFIFDILYFHLSKIQHTPEELKGLLYSNGEEYNTITNEKCAGSWVWGTPLILALRRQRQATFYEFKPTLAYMDVLRQLG